MRTFFFALFIFFYGMIHAQAPCEIFNMTVTTGDCHPNDSTYVATINFEVENPTASFFDLWGNNQYLGTYMLSALPVTIQHFPYNGGANDVVKACIKENPNCCRIKEFPVPACINAPLPCEISNLTVTTGDCHPNDSTYVATIDFEVANPTNASFGIWANNQFMGSFPLSALPVTIQNFPYNGGTNDVVKVCINDNANCCKIKEFPVPACITGNQPCEISNLTVTTGDCHPNDSTYVATINFDVANPTNASFGIWANNQFMGSFPLSALPVTIQNFPYNGGTNDVVKVCINDNANCCKVKEFPVPACITGNQPCEIYDLTVMTGDCNPDSTYSITIDFEVANTTNASFDLWGNGQYIGFYPLSALPLTIAHFPNNSNGSNAYIKVCINDNADCCKIKEFAEPNCAGANCHIYDLNVQTTGCLCGQFFAVLTFVHNGGGSGGFDIVGNGVNYGNFPYSHPQPIILGPLEGDNTTFYEFVVKDHEIAGCKDAFELGKIDCPESPTLEIINPIGALHLSPNPATTMISVNATLTDGVVSGSGQVLVMSTDGRTVKNISVGTAASFSINIGDLPPGTYEIVLETERGRLTGKFNKI